MSKSRRLIAVALALAAGVASCNPASASPGADTGAVVGAVVGAQVTPITCSKNGTLITCRHGATGNVEVQLQDYANCIVESDCTMQWVHGQGSGYDDFRFFLTGTD